MLALCKQFLMLKHYINIFSTSRVRNYQVVYTKKNLLCVPSFILFFSEHFFAEIRRNEFKNAANLHFILSPFNVVCVVTN